MHPQTYLKTFWRLELRPQVFVAMSFAPQYDTRFKQVISPAIQSLVVERKTPQALSSRYIEDWRFYPYRH